MRMPCVPSIVLVLMTGVTAMPCAHASPVPMAATLVALDEAALAQVHGAGLDIDLGAWLAHGTRSAAGEAAQAGHAHGAQANRQRHLPAWQWLDQQAQRQERMAVQAVMAGARLGGALLPAMAPAPMPLKLSLSLPLLGWPMLPTTLPNKDKEGR